MPPSGNDALSVGGGRELGSRPEPAARSWRCSGVGIECDVYSLGYVATWAGGGEAVKAIKASGSRIQKTADQILSALVAGNGPLN